MWKADHQALSYVKALSETHLLKYHLMPSFVTSTQYKLTALRVMANIACQDIS